MAAGVGPPLRWAVIGVALEAADADTKGGVRRALVVSYEAFHRSGLVTVCPITTARQTPHYPGEVALPAGEAGQTKDVLILCARLQTVALRHVRASPEIAYVTDPPVRSAVRAALRHHLGLDIPPLSDGAAPRQE